MKRLPVLVALLGSTAYAQPTPEAPTPVETPAAEPPPPPAPPPTLDPAALQRLIDERVAAQLAAKKPNAGWDNGFFVQSDDGKHRLRIGGFIQFDGRFFVNDKDDPHTDQFAFRSIRPELSGTLYDHYDFRLLPDFAGGRLVVQEAYGDIRYSDQVKIRFGKFKVPFGLERLQAEVSTTFAERGLPTQVAPNRDLGVQVFGELAKVVEYQVGVFNGVADGQSGDGDVSDDKELAARVFVKPFRQGPLRGLGVGGAVTYGDKLGTVASPDVLSFRTAGQSTIFAYKLGTTLTDTVIGDGPHWRATAQGHYYAGPVGLLGEWVRSRQKVALDGSHQRVTVDAWQAVAQWVVTGDDATFKSVAPKHPFDPAKGQWGAFDIAARIGQLTVDGAFDSVAVADPTRSAHEAWSGGAGVDWFPNRNIRIILDYEHTWYAGGGKTGDKPDEDSIVGRFQLVF